MDECQNKILPKVTCTIPAIFRETSSSLKDKGLDMITKLPEFKNVKFKLYLKRNRSIGIEKVF